MTNVESYDVKLLMEDDWVALSSQAPVNGVSISFDGSSATVSGLPPDYVRYIFLVRARNAAGVSGWEAALILS